MKAPAIPLRRRVAQAARSPCNLSKEHRDLTDCQSYLLFHAEYVA
jgi:hypothetical protein